MPDNPEKTPALMGDIVQDSMVLWVAIAPEDNPARVLMHTVCQNEADAKLYCGRGWRVGKFVEVPHA